MNDLFGPEGTFSFCRQLGARVAIVGPDCRAQRTNDRVISPEAYEELFKRCAPYHTTPVLVHSDYVLMHHRLDRMTTRRVHRVVHDVMHALYARPPGQPAGNASFIHSFIHEAMVNVVAR